MEIIVDQETFLDGVQRIAALTDRKNAALVGSQVLLDAQGETVTLYASGTQTGGRF
jgi:DNA polymerase III sliding clamp (beta) subunit (PCNA family)